jgi:hypothetical protein
VGFVVDTVALGQVFSQALRFSPVSFIPPVRITWKIEKKLIILFFIFITGLHNKPQGCGAPVASAAGPFSEKKLLTKEVHKHSLMVTILTGTFVGDEPILPRMNLSPSEIYLTVISTENGAVYSNTSIHNDHKQIGGKYEKILRLLFKSQFPLTNIYIVTGQAS